MPSRSASARLLSARELRVPDPPEFESIVDTTAVIAALHAELASRGREFTAPTCIGPTRVHPLTLRGDREGPDEPGTEVEAKFVVQVTYNDSSPITIRVLGDLSLEVLEVARGATIHPELGIWQDGSRLWVERGLLFFVCTPDLAGLHAMLGRWACTLGQHEMLLVTSPGSLVHHVLPMAPEGKPAVASDQFSPYSRSELGEDL